MVDKYSIPQQVGAKGRRSFHVMAKPAGSTCNLDCEYCFYLSKERLPKGPGTGPMSDETLELFIQQYIEGVAGPEVVFSWQGGEPSTGRNLIRVNTKWSPDNASLYVGVTCWSNMNLTRGSAVFRS